MGPKKSKMSLVQFGSGIQMDVYSVNEHVYLEQLRPLRPNGCVSSRITHFSRMNMSVRRTDMCLFKIAAPIPTKQIRLFGIVMPIMIELMCLL